ncbi:MAG: proton-translocating NADH-quinone oxidoreductase, chain [Bacteroidota bacterium]|nr:proton-translocating NADH-quinone oxidoreductase, chain [Bacteroidota bacterium]
MLLLGVLFFPLAAAALVYLSGNRRAKYAALILAFGELVASWFLKRAVPAQGVKGLVYNHAWITNPHISFALSVDGLSLVLILLTTFLIPFIILTTFKKEVDNAKSFYSLILLMQFALIGVFAASDGFLFYIFWELALIPIYFIALLWGEGRDREFRNRAIFKFFIYTLAGSLFMLLGFIWLYGKAGNSFSLAAFYSLKLSAVQQAFGFLTIFIAFAIKIPIIPFHTWQAETYKEAPAAGSMLLAGIMLKMGLYGLLRWLLPILPLATLNFTPYVIALCVIGVVYGSIIAIKQSDIKRLIAYSSLAHVGLIAAGIFTLTKEGFEGSVIQMVSHGINVVAIFFVAEIIFQRTGTFEIGKLGGIRNVAPKFATCFLIIVLASVALPGTNGFIGEFLLLFGIYEYNTWLSIIAGLTIILGAVYMFRMYQNVMLGETNSLTSSFADLTWSEWAVFVPAIVAIFVIGIYPKPILNMVHPALDNILTYALR